MSFKLDLVPGDALSPFQLGASLFNTLNLLQSYRQVYPSVKVAWDEDAPSTAPIHLILSTPPVSLLFHPLSQRLTRIEVREHPGDWVEYHGRSLRQDLGQGVTGEDGESDVVKTIRRVMGPTYSASSDNGGGEEVLSYPGVAFGVVKIGNGGSKLSRIVITPLPAPPNVPVQEAWLHPTLPDSPAVSQGDLRLVEIKVNEARLVQSVALSFHFPDSTTPPDPIVLQIGKTTSEDLLCELGSPIRSFWKEDDRMSIHSASAQGDAALSPNPYFISHPHLGLTFLIHPTSHTLLKIILHSNLPGEVNFGRSSRCSWEIVTPNSDRKGSSHPFSAISNLLLSSGDDGRHLGVHHGANGSQRSASVDSSGSHRSGGSGRSKGSKGEHSSSNGIRDHASLSGEPERPMILDRTVDGGDGAVNGKTTEIHGFPGIALEVTGSGDVETVWLF
ncbi:hypothetical protein T439DRAFT_328065 [Meredithblackwellia eburnea MCA 4105]